VWSDISTWASEAAAVFAKEWRCELRTRYALSTLGLFAFTTLVVVSVSLGPLGVMKSQGSAVLPVLFWVILLFSATAGLPGPAILSDRPIRERRTSRGLHPGLHLRQRRQCA